MFIELKEKYPLVYEILFNQIENNKLSHAYIFVGADLEETKIISAYLFNQKEEKNINHRIMNNNYPDIEIINSDDSQIKKDAIISLQQLFSKKPLEADKQIYIIDEAEKLNSSAYNTLLKFLEEPTDNIIALLNVNNINLLPATIISRCQIIYFNKLNEVDENLNIDSEILKIIIRSFENNKVLSKKDSNFLEDREETKNILKKIIKIYSLTIENYNRKTEVEIIENLKDKKIQNLSKKISILLEALKHLEYNGNINLIFDKIKIDFGGINNA